MKPEFSVALRIIRTLRAFGHEAMFAGGCVRDKLMGREPKDFDIATSARPEQVQAAFEATEAVGAAFGVILVILDGAAYEVATFRSDGEYRDGRHPESVRFSSPEEDAMRRDFTVNGIFYDPDADEFQDFVGGKADLKKKMIRAIGDPSKRFDEDKLRVLRAVRFAVQLGFEIDAATWEAAKAFAAQISIVAWERIQAELSKILISPNPRRGIELLDEAGLVEALLPELLPLKGCAQPPQFHPEGDVWEHTLRVMAELRTPSVSLAWGGLLHDIGKPKSFSQEPGDRIRFNGHESLGGEMAGQICGRLKMSTELSEAACALVADHLRLNPIKEMKLATLKRLLRRPDFKDLLELHRADCVASHGDMELYEYALAKFLEYETAEAAQSLRPAALLDGADLISMGYKPGPVFKEILNALEDEQLEGRLSDKKAAIDFVQQKYPQ
jgi:poly(A) polymerase